MTPPLGLIPQRLRRWHDGRWLRLPDRVPRTPSAVRLRQRCSRELVRARLVRRCDRDGSPRRSRARHDGAFARDDRAADDGGGRDSAVERDDLDEAREEARAYDLLVAALESGAAPSELCKGVSTRQWWLRGGTHRRERCRAARQKKEGKLCRTRLSCPGCRASCARRDGRLRGA